MAQLLGLPQIAGLTPQLLQQLAALASTGAAGAAGAGPALMAPGSPGATAGSSTSASPAKVGAGAGAATTPSAATATPTKVLLLLNMVSASELNDDEEFKDILLDVRDECQRFGAVERVVIPRPLREGAAAPTDAKSAEGESDSGDVGPRTGQGVGRIFVQVNAAIQRFRVRFSLWPRFLLFDSTRTRRTRRRPSHRCTDAASTTIA